MASIVRMDVKEVLRHFKQLEDPRSPVNRLHPLDSVIVIAIMAVLAGANGPTAIANWAKIKSDILLKLLDLPNGIPRKDVYRRRSGHLEAGRLSSMFHNVADGTACRSRGGYGRGSTDSGHRRKDVAAKPRSPSESGGLAFRQRLGERVWPDARTGGHGGEIERNHGNSHTVVARRYPWSNHHHRRHGDPNSHRRKDY